KHSFLRRRNGIVLSVGGSDPFAALNHVRPRDHPAAGHIAHKQAARFLTYAIQFFERYHFNIGRDLKNTVRRRIDNRLSRRLVFRPQELNYLGARSRVVSNHFTAYGFLEFSYEAFRKSV